MTATKVGIVSKVRALVLREAMFIPSGSALVMVSGGQDSLSLLEILGLGLIGRAGPESIHALHVNHHLRGEESEADECLVRGHCYRLGVALTVVDRPMVKGMGNLMESAREARRRAALETAEEVGAERIVLGHTLDDQVETMLYRLGRYGGLAAFRGMTPIDPPWVRPLLTCRRAETAGFCAARGLEHAVDSGNAYPGYARTGIRERVLAAWEAVLPGAVEAAGRAAEVAGEMEELSRWVLSAASGLAAPGLLMDEGSSAVHLLFLPASLRRLLLFDSLERAEGLEAARASVLAVERLMKKGGSGYLDMGGAWRCHKENDRVWLERVGGLASESGGVDVASGRARAVALKDRPAVSLHVPGQAEWEGVAVRAEYVEFGSADAAMTAAKAADFAREAYLDAAALSPVLTVRGPQPGDRVRPLGASGSRKLQDIFVDRKVPARLRPQVPLVLSGERILWVGGMVTAEEGRITGETTRIARLSLQPVSGDRQ